VGLKHWYNTASVVVDVHSNMNTSSGWNNIGMGKYIIFALLMNY